MVNEVENNMYLVNAPAGSGKTTWIRKQVENHLLHYETDNILCITYTNRAAEELGKDMDSDKVYFGTIHSFLNNFIGSFFSHREIINLYCELYKEKIIQRINSDDPKVIESNNRYSEKYGSLNLETVFKNITSISYGETPYTSLYYGALSHDDLVTFSRAAIERYPNIRRKLADKFQLIFIDEYQDTSADVLHIFYSAMKGSKGRLYLLGDKMQQIYKNYDGSFEKEFSRFDRTKKLEINYRTTPHIVSILNSIYNDNSLKQIPYEKNNDSEMQFKPCVIFSDNKDETISDFVKSNPDTLILYPTNRERFVEVGAENLFQAFNQMDKYGFAKKYTAVDVLIKEDVRQNDILLNMIFKLMEICDFYQKSQYGYIFKVIKENDKMFQRKEYTIRSHSDKKKIQAKFKIILDAFENVEISIKDYLMVCKENLLLQEEYYERIFESDDYKQALLVELKEVKKLRTYLLMPNVSTQHGVKGESHDTVLFVAEDCKNRPYIYMNSFFEMWSNIDVVLTELDRFYYKYMDLINLVKQECGEATLTKLEYKNHKNSIDQLILNFISENKDNDYYVSLLKEKMEKFENKKNCTNAKACLSENNVYAVLSAYRLFYVGCSRARKNLAIIVQNKDVTGCKKALQEKLKSIGFEIK